MKSPIQGFVVLMSGTQDLRPRVSDTDVFLVPKWTVPWVIVTLEGQAELQSSQVLISVDAPDNELKLAKRQLLFTYFYLSSWVINR